MSILMRNKFVHRKRNHLPEQPVISNNGENIHRRNQIFQINGILQVALMDYKYCQSGLPLYCVGHLFSTTYSALTDLKLKYHRYMIIK